LSLLLLVVCATGAAAGPIGFLVGYAVQERTNVCSIQPNTIQEPLFTPYNRDSVQWWYNLVEEAAFSNAQYIALNFRGDSPCGAYPPAGNQPTHFVSTLVQAINTRGYTSALKVALFDDTGSYPHQLKDCTGSATFDLGNRSHWESYFWTTRWKPFFDRVPDANRMKIRGRPLVFLWSVADPLFVNHRGNLGPLVQWLRARTQAAYGFDPFIIVNSTWVKFDPAVGPLVDGVDDWFDVAAGIAATRYTHEGRSGSFTTGVAHPGFYFRSPFMFIDRRGGETLRAGLDLTSTADVVLLEGLSDIEENAAFYRGASRCSAACSVNVPPPGQCWSTPNQYLNIVREYANPYPELVVFEAEAADRFSVQSTTGTGLYRRHDPLRIYYTDPAQSQWAVELTSGEWLAFAGFELGDGSARVRVRYSSTASARVRITIGGISGDVSLEPTGHVNTYRTADITNLPVSAGRYDVRLDVISGSARIDSWTYDGDGLLPRNGDTTGCSISVPEGVAAPHTAGDVMIAVTASAADCYWDVKSQVSWLAVMSPSPGVGTATVRLSAGANIGSAPRSGTVVVGGRSVVVTQAAYVPVPAQIVSPASGQSLAGETQVFSWNAGIDATEYRLDVGRQRGGSDILRGGSLTVRSATVGGLPLDGSAVWVRLHSRIQGAWVAVDTQYQALQSAPASMTMPTAGAVLKATDQGFAWSAGVGVSAYWLDIGRSLGGYDLYSNYLGSTRSFTLDVIPDTGEPVWVRLWSRIGGAWTFVDHRYEGPPPGPARITSPAPGSQLTGTSVTLTWSGSSLAAGFWVNVGTSQGAYDIHSDYAGTARGTTISGLPLTGTAVWIRLHSLVNGTWQFVDHQYVAATPFASRLVTPAPGSALAGATQQFEWERGVGVEAHWFDLGRSQGGYELFSAAVGTATGITVAGLPVTAERLWARLWSRINGQWTFRDYPLTAASPGPAVITTPSAGALLPATRPLFSWSEGTGVSAYWLDVGRVRGGYSVFSNFVGTSRSVALDVPADGGDIWVRLFSLINGEWQFVDHQFTAPLPSPGVITSPAAGAKIDAPWIDLKWSSGVGVEAFWLDVGTAQGGYNIYSNYRGMDVAARIPGLPPDGGRIWVRLWSRIGGAWRFVDQSFEGLPQKEAAVIISPLPDSTFTSTSVLFSWTAGKGVEAYRFSVGTSKGSDNLYRSGDTGQQAALVSALPTNGKFIYVRLSSKIGGQWVHQDYRYRAMRLTAGGG